MEEGRKFVWSNLSKNCIRVNEVIYRISKFYRVMGESREQVLNNSLKNFANEQRSRKYLMNSIQVFLSYFLHYFEVHVCLLKHFQIIYRRYSLIVARVLIFGSSKKILPNKWNSLSPVFHLLYHFIIHIPYMFDIKQITRFCALSGLSVTLMRSTITVHFPLTIVICMLLQQRIWF